MHPSGTQSFISRAVKILHQHSAGIGTKAEETLKLNKKLSHTIAAVNSSTGFIKKWSVQDSGRTRTKLVFLIQRSRLRCLLITIYLLLENHILVQWPPLDRFNIQNQTSFIWKRWFV